MCKIIGHRGNKEFYIENTLKGFESVLNDKNISGIELDLQLTKDKELVIFHDNFIKLDNKKYYINNLTLEELKNLVKDLHGNNEKNIGVPFPLFEEVLELYNNHLDKILLVELKSLANKFSYSEIQEIIMRTKEKLNLLKNIDNVYIISFDYRMIREANKQTLDVKKGLILSRNLIPLEGLLNDCNINIIVMQKDWIVSEQVKFLQNKGLEVYAWTVNTKDEYKKLCSLGVNIITDYPKTIFK